MSAASPKFAWGASAGVRLQQRRSFMRHPHEQAGVRQAAGWPPGGSALAQKEAPAAVGNADASPGITSTRLAGVCECRVAAPAKSSDGGISAYSADSASSAAPAKPAANPNTLSPTATSVTPSPSSSTTPATSPPVLCGSSPPLIPLGNFQSIGFTPTARTATRICPGAGRGSGSSTSSRTSGPPNWLNWIAFTRSALAGHRGTPRDHAPDQYTLEDFAGTAPWDLVEDPDPHAPQDPSSLDVSTSLRPRAQLPAAAGGTLLTITMSPALP
jgi:hypothetical protein